MTHRFDHFGQELVNLLLASTHQSSRVHGIREINLIKGVVRFQSVEKIIVTTLLLDNGGGFLAVLANFFVKFLAVATGGNGFHEDVFRDHER